MKKIEKSSTTVYQTAYQIKCIKKKKKTTRTSKEILSNTVRDFDKPLSELEKSSKPEIR